MRDDEDREYYRAHVVRDTEQAELLHLETSNREVWVPKQLREWHREGVVTIASWFAKKEGII